MGLEILEQRADVAAVYVPMGGGGLIAGVSAAIKQRRPDVRVIGVEPAGAAKMTASRAAGRPVTLEQTASIADGLLALRPGDLTFAHVQAFVDEIVTVLEDCDRACDRMAVPGSAPRRGAERRGHDGGHARGCNAAAARNGRGGLGGNMSAEDYAGYLTM